MILKHSLIHLLILFINELVDVEGHPTNKNSLQYTRLDNWLMPIFPLVVELNLVKYRQRFGCLPWGKRPTLA